MRVRIRRLPPSPILEGVDLRPYTFREGRLYELDPPVAKVLLSWGYAERHPKATAEVPAQARTCSKCGSSQTSITARSENPPLVHLKCGSCGYVSVHSMV
jgi:ribosomal protein S27AE